MQELISILLKEGKVVTSEYLNADSFINQQINSDLMKKIGIEFSKSFAKRGITKILTLESSGIAPAIMTACELNVPVIVAKRGKPTALTGEFFFTKVESVTRDETFIITLASDYIKPTDGILIIDDILAYGSSLAGLIELVDKAGADVKGIGIVLEKKFQNGRRNLGIHASKIISLVEILGLSENKIIVKQ